MKIRMKIPVTGTFHGHTSGVKVGDVVDVDDDNGARYCALGYAEMVAAEERAVAPKAETATKPMPKPEPKPSATKTP